MDNARKAVIVLFASMGIVVALTMFALAFLGLRG